MMILMLRLISNDQCNGTNKTGTIIATIDDVDRNNHYDKNYNHDNNYYDNNDNNNNNPTATATLEWPHGLP